MDELIVQVYEKTYAYGAIRAENQNLLSTIFELKKRLEKVKNGKSVNTKFDKTNGYQSFLCVAPLNKHVFQKKTDVPKIEENHVVSKLVTLQTSPTEIHAVEKERKARTMFTHGYSQGNICEDLRGLVDAKEIWKAIRTRFGGNANLKKMHKAVLKQQQFKRDSFYQDQGARKKEQKQNCLLTMDDGVVNWGEHTVEEEESNHALMAISSSNEVSLCSKTCIDSYNKLKTLCDEQMNQLGVPHPLSGDYTPKPQEEIDESLYVYGKKGPQEPEPSVSDDRSSECSTCQSNDNARSIGTSSEHSVDLESEISRGFNHANQFVPRPVQLNAGRPNINSVRPNINTGRTNINSVRPNINTGRTNINSVRPNINTGRTNINSVRPRVNTGSSNVNTDQTVLGKDYSNLLIADSLLKTIWFINAPCYGNEALASPKVNGLTIPEQMATGKGISNPFMAGSLPKIQKPIMLLCSCDAEEMRCKFKIESESNLEIPLNVRDSEDTLEDAFKSKQKMTEKMNDPIAVAIKQNCWTINYKKLNALYKDFAPQKELSVEQKYFPSSSIPSIKIPLDELEKQNDLLKDQLLEASLKQDVDLCVLINHECVDKILNVELEKVKKKSFEIQEGLQARIKILEKDVKSKVLIFN
ncbi:hypothetical protein Tco_0704447 [Tanacetum coccineum]|uniref:Uncharacterized protein n=1 Tax=Tanacetum coccineum TaxID=301880 RepID=A0ABQ4Y217_9ASTR